MKLAACFCNWDSLAWDPRGRRDCNGNVNSLSRISQILNGEMARIYDNCESFVDTYRARSRRTGRSIGPELLPLQFQEAPFVVSVSFLPFESVVSC